MKRMADENGRAGRERTRRRRSSGLIVFLTILFIAVIGIVGAAIFFRVSEVEIEGESRYTDEQIISASGIEIGDSMLMLRGGPSEEAIKSEMPYIGNVSIEKQYPGKVVIKVDERAAVACMRVGNETWLLDSNLKALEVTDGLAVKTYSFIKGFTTAKASAGHVLSVGEEEKTKLRYASEVLSSLEELGIIGDVTLVDVSNISGITVEYQNRFKVKLGTGENIGHKLARLDGIIPYLDDDDRGVIDVSGDSESYFIPD
ncbi:MAG: FtsQ-type POTRA domain-containing protein [Oscillospiraceae bacterium]|nr:FtsQ-type POTRA domain-containing protein [Oscillospiraceae bacterium]